MIRIAMVEDTQGDADRIEELIRQYAGERGEEIKVMPFQNAIVFLNDYRPIYDIVLLDVQMPHMDGMEAAQRLRELDPLVPLIFITNMSNYATRGYSVSALDFVVKPVVYNSFASTLDRAIRVAKARSDEIILKTSGKNVKVALNAIAYLEADKHQIIYHTDVGDFAIWGTLREQEERLPQDRFARASKYCIVNLKHITAFNANEITVGGSTIVVTRSQKKSFSDALLKYYGQYL